eukprot:SAG22_NODE_3214_length_1854_cov_1.486040_2_plen_82_part_00
MKILCPWSSNFHSVMYVCSPGLSISMDSPSMYAGILLVHCNPVSAIVVHVLLLDNTEHIVRCTLLLSTCYYLLLLIYICEV